MMVEFNLSLAEKYESNTQRARVLTEDWVGKNMYCPCCGGSVLVHLPNNSPVADFACPVCNAEFELKSKNGKLGKKVNEGTYNKIIERINSDNNPNFFFMGYSRETWSIQELIVVPRHFFTPEIIEKRKPLSRAAHRAGWTGCNIKLELIPRQGRIIVINGGRLREPRDVVEEFRKSENLYVNDLSVRGWLLDILTCVNSIKTEEFVLEDVYRFSDWLYKKHPDNNNIKAKIRQQLQMLRDKEYIEFLGKGKYRRTKRCG